MLRNTGGEVRSNRPMWAPGPWRCFTRLAFCALLLLAGKLEAQTSPDPSAAGPITRLFPDQITAGDLANRTPLVLIHGIHGNKGPEDIDRVDAPYRDYWGTFLAYFDTDTFRQKYKIYRFHYESDRFPAVQIARALRNDLDDLVPIRDAEIVIVAHSIGGLIARSHMNHFTHYVSRFAGKRGGQISRHRDLKPMKMLGCVG